MIRRVGSEVFARQQRAISYRPDARPTLPAIGAPTLVICGADDAINPPEVSDEVASGIAESRLELIPGTGHLCNLEEPELTNELIGAFFLTLAS